MRQREPLQLAPRSPHGPLPLPLLFLSLPLPLPPLSLSRAVAARSRTTSEPRGAAPGEASPESAEEEPGYGRAAEAARAVEGGQDPREHYDHHENLGRVGSRKREFSSNPGLCRENRARNRLK